MSYNRQLASLQSSSGPATETDDPHTVRGLLRYCRGWLKGDIDAEALQKPCLEMANRLRGAAEATFSDLDKNPELCDEVRDPILDTGEAYEAIATILEDLPRLAGENRREEFEEALAEFETERLAVVDATDEINAQMSEGVPRCPKCGESGEDERCEHCRLILLYPDPKQLQDYSHRSAHLSPMHRQIYDAYVAVLKGELSLEGLLAKLPPLSAHLKELSSLCDGYEHSDQDWVDGLRNDIETAAAGIERIKGAASTYQTSDLHRGWEDIFDSSISVQNQLRQLGVATGELEDTPTMASDDLQFGLR